MRKGWFWLNDPTSIESHLPTNLTGPQRDDDRRIISAIVHMLQSGARWRDCPPEYGPCTTPSMIVSIAGPSAAAGAMFAALAKAGKDPVTTGAGLPSVRVSCSWQNLRVTGEGL